MKTRPTRAEILAELDRREKAKEGLSGIGEDVNQSVKKIPEAAGKLAGSVIPGINNVGNYATHNNPLKTGAQLGGGAIEAGASLASSPQVLARYLAEKFPGMGQAMERGKFHGKGINDPTMFEDLMRLEKENGLEANEEEGSVRSLGGLLSGAGVLRKIPSLFGRTGAIAAESGGRGGDPLHAAILGLLGEGSGKIPYRKAKDLPAALIDMAKAVPEKVKQIPQLKANMGKTMGAPMSATFKDLPKHVSNATTHASIDALESAAKTADKYHVPFVPRKLLTKAADLRYKTNPEEHAKEYLFGDIEESHLPEIKEVTDAAERLNMRVSPAEALQDPFEGGKQGNVGRTKEGRKQLYKEGKQRLRSEEDVINNFLDTVYNPRDMNAEKSESYRTTMQAEVPDDFIAQWSADPVVQDAISLLKSKSAYRKRLGDSPDNSFNYWNMVKRVMGDQTRKLRGTNPLKNTEADIIDATRNDMVRQMDHIEPEYANARRIAERDFTRRDIEHHFDKRKRTGNNFKKYISSQRTFDDLMEKIEPIEGAQQQLRDMRKVFENLIPNTLSPAAAAALARTSMDKPRNNYDAIKNELDQKHGEKHDVAIVKLLTNKDWPKILSKYLAEKKGTE